MGLNDYFTDEEIKRMEELPSQVIRYLELLESIESRNTDLRNRVRELQLDRGDNAVKDHAADFPVVNHYIAELGQYNPAIFSYNPNSPRSNTSIESDGTVNFDKIDSRLEAADQLLSDVELLLERGAPEDIERSEALLEEASFILLDIMSDMEVSGLIDASFISQEKAVNYDIAAQDFIGVGTSEFQRVAFNFEHENLDIIALDNPLSLGVESRQANIDLGSKTEFVLEA